jgi:hypothetical protein
MQFEINVPVAGTYAIWGRIVAWDGNSDSFWVTWEPTDPADADPQVSQDTTYRWGVAQSNTWAWDRINQWLDGGTFEREWEVDAGMTTLTIWTREAACMMDCIFITDNLSEDEAEVAPRVPTDEDLSVAAVEPNDKLAVTWGAIRSQ